MTISHPTDAKGSTKQQPDSHDFHVIDSGTGFLLLSFKLGAGDSSDDGGFLGQAVVHVRYASPFNFTEVNKQKAKPSLRLLQSSSPVKLTIR